MNRATLALRISFGLALAVLAASAAGLPARLDDPAPFLAELLLIVLSVPLAWSAARRALGEGAELRGPMRVAAIAIVLLVIGQLARSKKAFPLMPYTMYGRAATGNVTYYEYLAQHRSGAQSRFRPSAVISSLGRARIVKGLARRLDALGQQDGGGAPGHDRPLDLERRTIAALAAEHNAGHAGDPVMRIDVVRVELPPPFAPETARRQLVLSVDTTEQP